MYNLYRGLLPVWFKESPLVHVNDIVFHQALTQRILETGLCCVCFLVSHVKSVLTRLFFFFFFPVGQHDAWVPYWGSGAAVLRYYQNFSHLAAAALAKLAGRIKELRVKKFLTLLTRNNVTFECRFGKCLLLVCVPCVNLLERAKVWHVSMGRWTFCVHVPHYWRRHVPEALVWPSVLEFHLGGMGLVHSNRSCCLGVSCLGTGL